MYVAPDVDGMVFEFGIPMAVASCLAVTPALPVALIRMKACAVGLCVVEILQFAATVTGTAIGPLDVVCVSEEEWLGEDEHAAAAAASTISGTTMRTRDDEKAFSCIERVWQRNTARMGHPAAPFCLRTGPLGLAQRDGGPRCMRPAVVSSNPQAPR